MTTYTADLQWSRVSNLESYGPEAETLPLSQIAKKVAFHTLSAKAFPRKPFRKPLPQGLHRKAFYELTHRQGLNDKPAKAFPRKPFRKPFPQN
ncbi:hypothetical protein AVEN_29203-1 [Araneus ventricosus]|uniref:Uncharacterized protein n=1 Tax=Araneus ventricosus TaxID=182803 RepID=A0A4Y2AK56_ARAVE|nr:hypothetical protein AVEN_29203-1 [Araneus ventricosus]